LRKAIEQFIGQVVILLFIKETIELFCRYAIFALNPVHDPNLRNDVSRMDKESLREKRGRIRQFILI